MINTWVSRFPRCGLPALVPIELSTVANNFVALASLAEKDNGYLYPDREIVKVTYQRLRGLTESTSMSQQLHTDSTPRAEMSCQRTYVNSIVKVILQVKNRNYIPKSPRKNSKSFESASIEMASSIS